VSHLDTKDIGIGSSQPKKRYRDWDRPSNQINLIDLSLKKKSN